MNERQDQVAALATTLTTTRTTTTTTTDVAKERLEGRPRKAGRAAFRRRRLRCYATTRRAQDNEAFHFEIARLEQRLQELAKAR